MLHEGGASPVASGRIVSTNLKTPTRTPWWRWDAEDVRGILPIEYRQVSLPETHPYRQPILATEFVRYVGEPVASSWQLMPTWLRTRPISCSWISRTCRRFLIQECLRFSRPTSPLMPRR